MHKCITTIVYVPRYWQKRIRKFLLWQDFSRGFRQFLNEFLKFLKTVSSAEISINHDKILCIIVWPSVESIMRRLSEQKWEKTTERENGRKRQNVKMGENGRTWNGRKRQNVKMRNFFLDYQAGLESNYDLYRILSY